MSLLDLTGPLDALSPPVTLVRIRASAPAIERGRVVPDADAEADFVANVQPTSGRDLQRLPEGARSSETITVWSKTELRTATSNAPADRVRYRGRIYEAQSLEDWSQLGGYFKAICAAVED